MINRETGKREWWYLMIPATDDEIKQVTEYMAGQAADLTVEFLQKIYVENVGGHAHAVWDVHTNEDRWWVITNPTNLYSQQQFPNMDYALTFHIGLCIRIPRTEKQKLSDLPIEPFAACYRVLSTARDTLLQADGIADYQGIGVKCRETLLTFVDAAQTVLPWTSTEERPQRANFKAWVDHVCTVVLPGSTHEDRRHLFKTLLDSAWKFTNWLTHSKRSHVRDAEAAIEVTESATTLSVSAIIQYLRGVPDDCPACGSQHLSPERGVHTSIPDVLWERPTCDDCGWVGEPVEIKAIPEEPEPTTEPPDSECVIPQVPLRYLKKPGGPD
jgi:hypothetical protein